MLADPFLVIYWNLSPNYIGDGNDDYVDGDEQ